MWCRTLSSLVVALGISLAWGQLAFALDVPAAPPLSRPVVDQTNTLNGADIDAISNIINESRAKKDYQMGVLLVPTLGNSEYLEGYSLKVAREWGIGADAKDNGVLLLVVMNDRQARIEVGRGLEGDLTDSESGRIIRSVMAPQFKNGNYATGIEKAIQSIAAQVEGKADPNAATATSSSGGGFDIMPILFMGFWILPWLGSILARSKSWWAGGMIAAGIGFGFSALLGWVLWSLIGAGILTLLGFLFDYTVSKNYRSRVSQGDSPSWWAGGTYWGGGSGDSSGSGGFGGGDFGGGGASGDW